MRGGRKLVSAQANASGASVKPRSGGRSYEGRSRYYEAEEADEAVAAYRANPSGRGLQPGAPAREYFRGSLTPTRIRATVSHMIASVHVACLRERRLVTRNRSAASALRLSREY